MKAKNLPFQWHMRKNCYFLKNKYVVSVILQTIPIASFPGSWWRKIVQNNLQQKQNKRLIHSSTRGYYLQDFYNFWVLEYPIAKNHRLPTLQIYFFINNIFVCWRFVILKRESTENSSSRKIPAYCSILPICQWKNNLFLNKKGAEKHDSTQNKEMKDRYNRIPHTHLSTIELEESKGPVFEPLKLLAAAAGNLIVLQDT